MLQCFTYAAGDHQLLTHVCRAVLPALRALNTVTIEKDRTTVLDVNGDGAVIEGLTFGDPALETLLKELGVQFDKARLHDVSTVPSGKKEFKIVSRYPWGHDRVL